MCTAVSYDDPAIKDVVLNNLSRGANFVMSEAVLEQRGAGTNSGGGEDSPCFVERSVGSEEVSPNTAAEYPKDLGLSEEAPEGTQDSAGNGKNRTTSSARAIPAPPNQQEYQQQVLSPQFSAYVPPPPPQYSMDYFYQAGGFPLHMTSPTANGAAYQHAIPFAYQAGYSVVPGQPYVLGGALGGSPTMMYPMMGDLSSSPPVPWNQQGNQQYQQGPWGASGEAQGRNEDSSEGGRPVLSTPGPPIQLVPDGHGPDGCNLFVFHIPNEMSNLDLFNHFTPFGNVISARIMVDNDSGRSRGFGFVSYDEPASANEAIAQMNGLQIGNKRLKVQHKKDKGSYGNGYGPEYGHHRGGKGGRANHGHQGHQGYFGVPMRRGSRGRGSHYANGDLDSLSQSIQGIMREEQTSVEEDSTKEMVGHEPPAESLQFESTETPEENGAHDEETNDTSEH
mmetsp:Transcript_63577/g.143423  ORF Transcript_63577/g.143423 Transcript_63577/m.143423 type:complete len:449 (-) Transcript_63577:142-1488(-)